MPLLAVLFAAALIWAAPSPAGAVKIERVVSPGGIEAWLVQDRLIPMLALEFNFRGGATLDPAGKEGLANLFSDLLTEGAGEFDAQEFQGRLEDRAITLGFTSGLDSIQGTFKTLNQHRDVAVELLRLALTRPRFAPEEVERARQRTIAGLARTAEDPGTLARRTWMQTAFPGHPYSRPVRGEAESVRRIGVDDLRAAHRRHLGRDNLIVGAVGDITPEALGRLLDQAFGELPAQAPALAELGARVAEAVPQGLGRTLVVRRKIPQSTAIFGAAGVKRDDPDYYAALAVNYILGGGGFNSRLTVEVREKRGLAYSVNSGLALYDRAGLVQGSVGTENARVGRTLELIRDEWRRMGDSGPSEAELADAKTYLNGSFPLGLDSTGRIARTLVAIQYDRLGLDFLERRDKLINAVTPEQARAVARRLYDPDRLLSVIVGDPEDLSGAEIVPAPPRQGG